MLNESANCYGLLHGHSFPYTGSNCLACGVNQRELSGMSPVTVGGASSIKSALTSLTQKIQAPQQSSEKPKPDGIHTQIHWLVNEMRRSFGETAKKGKGSFGFYLGCLNRMGFETAYATWQEIEKSDVANKQRLFWWKYGKVMKSRKSGKVSVAKV